MRYMAFISSITPPVFPWDNTTERSHIVCSNLVILLAIPHHFSTRPHKWGTFISAYLEDCGLSVLKLYFVGTTTPLKL